MKPSRFEMGIRSLWVIIMAKLTKPKDEKEPKAEPPPAAEQQPDMPKKGDPIFIRTSSSSGYWGRT